MDHTVAHFEIPAVNPAWAALFYRALFGCPALYQTRTLGEVPDAVV